MECINCNNTDSLNRIVINQLTGEKLGTYCEDCESSAFGELLNNRSWHQQHGCAFCDGAGKYKLPKLDCIIENDDGSIRMLEYATFGITVTICEDHLREILPNDETIDEVISNDQDSEPPVEA